MACCFIFSAPLAFTPFRRMNRWKRLARDGKGVSPILSTMLILLLMVTMITTVLLWATPTIEDFETVNQYSSMRGLMESIDNRVDFLLEMGLNTSVSTDVVVPPGALSVEENVEFWVLSYRYSNPNMEESTYFRYTDFEQNELNEDGKFMISSNYNGTVDVIIRWPADGADQSQYRASLLEPMNISTVHPVTRTFTITILDEDEAPLSGCVIFPSTGIRGDFASPRGVFAFRAVNAGVVTEYPDPSDPKLISAPQFVESATSEGASGDHYTSSGQLILSFVDFDSTGLSRVGQGNYRVDMHYRGIRPFDIGPVNEVRIQVFSKYRDSIYDGYTSSIKGTSSGGAGYTGFMKDDDGGNIVFRTGNTDDSTNVNKVELRVNEHFIDVNIQRK